MKVKGTTVKSIKQFVKDTWPDRYEIWLNSLPKASKDIMSGSIYATDWFPLQEAAVTPTYYLKMFYNEDNFKAAWQAGRYSAETTLTGVYKVFVKVANPGYIIKRASRITATYYENVKVDSSETTSNSVVVTIHKFEDLDKMIEYRIGGWMERALELSGCDGVRIRITQSLTKGDAITKYKITWK